MNHHRQPPPPHGTGPHHHRSTSSSPHSDRGPPRQSPTGHHPPPIVQPQPQQRHLHPPVQQQHSQYGPPPATGHYHSNSRVVLPPWGDRTGYSPLALSPHQAHYSHSRIVVHDHDVLSGRGINIAQHPGNERFRALVTLRADDDYCAKYSTTEKRAVAKEIVAHIRNLDPPGRFLRRPPRVKHSHKGLDGPWEELPPDEVLKKTCQALRDCNRQDRTGYASSVAVPSDVRENLERRTQTGLTNKQHAELAAAQAKLEADAVAELRLFGSGVPPPMAASSNGTARLPAPLPGGPGFAGGTISPSVESAAHWLKQQQQQCRDLDLSTPRTSATTPSTASAATATFDQSFASSTQSQSPPSSSSPTVHPPSHQYLPSYDDSHPHISSSTLPLSPARADHYQSASQYHQPLLDDDEAATAAALAAAAALYHHPQDQHHHLDRRDGIAATALSESSTLGHGSLDPLHLAASAVAALERHQHQNFKLEHGAAASSTMAHQAMHPPGHRQQSGLGGGVSERLHDDLHVDRDSGLGQDDHDPLDPADPVDPGDSALRYSPVPASPFRDADEFADEVDDDVHHPHRFFD